MKLIFSRRHTFQSSGVYFSATCVFHNDKHFVIANKDPIPYLATSCYFDTVPYTNKGQLSRTLNMKIQPLSCFYCVCLVFVCVCVKYFQRLSYHVEQHH